MDAELLERLDKLEKRVKAIEDRLMPQSFQSLDFDNSEVQTFTVEWAANKATEGSDPVG